MSCEEKAIHIRSNSNPLNVGLTEMYNVTEPKRGFAVIINNYEFSNKDKLTDLPGGQSDTKRLCHTLNEMQFIVKEHENMNSNDISRIIKDYGRKNHKKYGCFLCVLSSHGTRDSIFGKDGVPISVIDLMNTIADCKTLEGKPKIFFVDACRKLSDDDRFKPDMTKPDCVICYSTLQGKTARMMPSTSGWKGSYFIKSLCDVLCTNGQELPLHSILEKLKQAVTKSCGKQSIEIRDSATKVISFVPDRDVCQTCTNLTVNGVCDNCKIVGTDQQNQIADNVCDDLSTVNTAFDDNITTGDIRIVLVGKTGEGKSSTGNTILGKEAFKEDSTGQSVTTETILQTANRFGHPLNVVDTPGLFDILEKNDKLKMEMEVKKSIAYSSPGPHAICFCMAVRRRTVEDLEAIHRYVELFDRNMYNYVIVVFTMFDEWTRNRKRKKRPADIGDYVKSLPPEIKKFLSDIDNRYIVFDNTKENKEAEEQVLNLLTFIDKKIVQKNECPYYRHEHFDRVENAVNSWQKCYQINRLAVFAYESFMKLIYKIVQFYHYVSRKMCQLCGKMCDLCKCSPTKGACYSINA